MTRTGKLVFEETAADWDAAFTEAWSENGGNLQSLGFALHALRHLFPLPDFQRFWSLARSAPGVITCGHLDIHDYGCALGDGTALLQAAFPGARVKGFDHSRVAVEIATRRWPNVTFEVGDVMAPCEDASLIWTSHCIEHTADAAACVHALIARCQALVVVVPWISAAAHGGHEGAEATEVWLARCPKPAYEAYYNTLRQNPKTGDWIAEGSWMYVWQGALAAT